MKLNREGYMNELFEDFKKIDEFRNHFKNDFFETFSYVIPILYHIEITESIKELLNMMADEAISFTEAVIDKDRNYPEYRKDEELKLMSSLIAKQKLVPELAEEMKQVKYELNSLILKYYPDIYELSAFGYRLLDRNVQFYTQQFVSGINYELKK
ncbi:hypothetical protein ACUNWD_15770 [Sunxiuqinia sp. A32]|uniref:hypothetical protein n=1 Tax=Sunxiuqinia sp. A32 TaxID=3461496 RepID=UPI0040453459